MFLESQFNKEGRGQVSPRPFFCGLGWLAGGFTLVMAVAVIAIYRQEGHTASQLYKLLLAGLRMFFVFLARVGDYAGADRNERLRQQVEDIAEAEGAV